MKTKLLVITILFAAFGLAFMQSVKADGIKIDEQTFPDKLLREYVALVSDSNTDGYLQQEEIDKMEVIDWDYDRENMMTAGNKENKYIIDCKGLEVFTNLKKLYLATCTSPANKGEIRNLNAISRLTKLEELYLSNNNLKTDIDLRKLSNLKSVCLLGMKNTNKVLLPEYSQLEFFVMQNSTGKSVDFSKQKKIKKINIERSNFAKYKFGKLDKLKRLRIIGEKKKGYNSKTKKLDLSGLHNLTSLQINSVRGLKKLTLGANKKLKTLGVFDCKKLKKLNISKLTKLKKVYVSKNTKVVKKKTQKTKVKNKIENHFKLYTFTNTEVIRRKVA